MMSHKLIGLLAALALPVAAQALPSRTQSGTFNGLSWIASSKVIGQTSTATIVGGGDPLYLAQAPKYRSTVGILMDYGAGGAYVCSGSLSSDRRSIITAGHCVSDGGKDRPDSVTAFFYNGDPTDPVVYNDGAAGVTTVAINGIHVNPLYTGEVIDDHDIAVLRLAGPAPKFAVGYDLYTGGDLTGLNYNIAGYGVRSDVGGSFGADLGPGRLRQGDNRYDFRLGDAEFDGFFDGGPEGFFGSAETNYSFLADFDNGLAANDASCVLTVVGLGFAPSAKFCNLGLGATEVSSGGGDSGGPQFVDGKLASITGYGLSFGNFYGDVDDLLNDTFGESNGFIPIYTNLAFINGVPEPGTWMMMIAGFGLIGATSRRARTAGVA